MPTRLSALPLLVLATIVIGAAGACDGGESPAAPSDPPPAGTPPPGGMPPPGGGGGTGNLSLRFHGHGVGDIDRVKLPLTPGRAVNVGQDFTVELWLKATLAENGSGACQGGGDGWIFGNIVIDRDVFGGGDFGDYGISVAGGRIAFGVAVGGSGHTICSGAMVADGRWRHVAVTRRAGGELRIFVDGQPSGQGQGPDGNVAYREGRGTSFSSSDPFLVIGAEKHDAGGGFPSFSGWVDELRISTRVRYDAPFSPRRSPFAPDGSTALLLHFDEGPVGPCRGAVIDAATVAGAPTNGTCRFGGASPSGPMYSDDAPF